MSVEHRNHARMPSFLGARLHLRYLNTSLDCFIRKISPDGARIVLPSHTLLPDVFDIEIMIRQATRRACIFWRDHCHFGLEFQDLPKDESDTVSLDLARRLKRLKDENTRLHRRLDDLSGGS